jgi:hypothetical protein
MADTGAQQSSLKQFLAVGQSRRSQETKKKSWKNVPSPQQLPRNAAVETRASSPTKNNPHEPKDFPSSLALLLRYLE